MATKYHQIEDGIKERLLAPSDEGEPSPFKPNAIQLYGCQLSDEEIAARLKGLVADAPAAMIFYAGGEISGEAGGLGSTTEEDGIFTVVYVAAAIAEDSVARGLGSQVGIYELLDWGKRQLNGQRVAGKIQNGIFWMRSRRFNSMYAPLTVAAYAQDYKTRVIG